MCCQADWKREIVPDHKFDFINVREFHLSDFWTRIKYIIKYIFILKNLAIYGLDIFTATTYILSNHWTNAIQRKCGDDCAVDVRFSIAKWVFVGCICFSFLLLGYETYKARRVIRSRDISYAFTNLMANDYYSLKSYDNFCLFCRINNSTKKTDDFAFFVYFTFKDWKRLLLADGPRQSINALTLYSFAYANGFNWSDLPSWWDNSAITAMLLFAICSTVLLFVGSLLLLIAASIMYVPLLCYIQGNLKEYVCHKVDKRIAELIQKNRRDRIRRAAALEKKLANGSIKDVPGIIPQPTLPNVSLDEDDMGRAMRKQRKLEAERGGPPVKREYVEYEVGREQVVAYPPTLDYNQPFDGYNEYGSSTNLAASAAPMGISYPPAPPPSTVSANSVPQRQASYTNPYASHQPAFPPRISEPQYGYSQPQSMPRSRSYELDYGYDSYAPLSIPHSTSQGRIHRSVSPVPSVDYGGLPYDRGMDAYQPQRQGHQPQGGWDYRR